VTPAADDPIGAWLAQGQTRYPGVSLEPAAFSAALGRMAPSTAWPELVLEDVFLVTACLAGNPPALTVLDELLARSSRLAAKGLDEAELAQRVRLALLVGAEGTPPKLTQFAGRGALVKWLSAVVQRTALNLARERKPADGDSGLRNEPASAADPERALMNVKDGAVFKRAFRAALEALPEKSRALLRMYYLEGFTADQIAQMYEVHRVSVARWLAQAKRELRAATREKLVNDALSPSHVDSLMRVSNVQFGASLEHACR
jgi:RNA polymerase sigma-70 factor (ECF subfamily)